MSDLVWWQRGIVYQIYPRSLQDDSGDGVGDLRGIRRRLGYLERLGVDAIWISPCYPSPGADHGYDISNYTDVDPRFGTLAEFDDLVRDAHARGLRVILDFVPNHTSDEHPWFVESRASRQSPKRDWYLWRDPAPGGGVPNNWISNFGGSPWEWDAATGQYYYHAFHKKQPDVNWRNPEVQRAMYDVMRFWLDRGVDGFRIDVLWHFVKDEDFRDNPPNPDWQPAQGVHHSVVQTYSTGRPEIFEIVRALRRVADEYADRVLIGELYLPVEELVRYYGDHGDGVHLPFNFQLVSQFWNARTIADLIERYEAALPPGAWPNWVLGNHDKPRVASRVGAAQARVAAMLLLMLRGTPTIYYGEEIGMHDVDLPPELIQDPQALGMPSRGPGRDSVRTPMQWSGEPGGGFTRAHPWLPLAYDYRENNVEQQERDPDSMLSLYRRLIALRRSEPALVAGGCTVVPATGDLLAFRRGPEFLIALNLGSASARLGGDWIGEVVIATHRERDGERVAGAMQLGADQGVVVRLAQPQL